MLGCVDKEDTLGTLCGLVSCDEPHFSRRPLLVKGGPGSNGGRGICCFIGPHTQSLSCPGGSGLPGATASGQPELSGPGAPGKQRRFLSSQSGSRGHTDVNGLEMNLFSLQLRELTLERTWLGSGCEKQLGGPHSPCLPSFVGATFLPALGRHVLWHLLTESHFS